MNTNMLARERETGETHVQTENGEKNQKSERKGGIFRQKTVNNGGLSFVVVFLTLDGKKSTLFCYFCHICVVKTSIGSV